MPWIDAHDIVEQITKSEIDLIPDAKDVDDIENEERDNEILEMKTYTCPICGDKFVSEIHSNVKVCADKDCRTYRYYKYHDNRPPRLRTKEMVRLHSEGKTVGEIHNMGFGSSDGNVRAIIRKFHAGEVKREGIYNRVGERRVKNGLPWEVPCTAEQK